MRRQASINKKAGKGKKACKERKAGRGQESTIKKERNEEECRFWSLELKNRNVGSAQESHQEEEARKGNEGG